MSKIDHHITHVDGSPTGVTSWEGIPLSELSFGDRVLLADMGALSVQEALGPQFELRDGLLIEHVDLDVWQEHQSAAGAGGSSKD